MNKSSSIILTIHNKNYLLHKTLSALKDFTDWRFTDIIFVIDGCNDGSLETVNFWCKENLETIKSKVIVADNVFETKANNLGCKESNADYVIFLQDDTLLLEESWNTRLLWPFKRWDDVFSVSGNCAHNWSYNTPGIDKEGWSTLLRHHDHANKHNTDRSTFYVRDTCNRGPLAIDRKLMAELNYFDEAFAPLSDDDHDLNMRAFKKFKKVSGFFQIFWFSKSEWGGTRDENGKTKQWVLDVNIKNSSLLYERHKDIIDKHTIENRNI